MTVAFPEYLNFCLTYLASLKYIQVHVLNNNDARNAISGKAHEKDK